MGGGVGCPGPHSSGTLPLFGRRGGGKNKNNRQAFVRGENRLLPLHAGAPGADLRKGPSVPYCQASNPTPTLETLSWRHIPGATPSVTYPHVLCVPYQALWSSHVSRLCARGTVLMLCPTSLPPSIMPPASCHICRMRGSAQVVPDWRRSNCTIS